MMDAQNLRYWTPHEDIDPRFTKAITGRDYGGTSPSPQYVIKCLTDMFGPVGVGFGWWVEAEGFERFGDTALHWCRIKFWHTDRANTFDAYGQTKAAYTTAAGKSRVDEDAPKKSMTDAIVKAASQVGVAANIFLGRWDDQKYVSAVLKEYTDAERADIPKFDARAAADRLIAKFTKQQTQADLTEAWDGERDCRQAIWDADKEIFAEVKAAIKARAEEITPKEQAA